MCEVFGFLEVVCFFLLVVVCVICVAWSSCVICVAVMFVWFSLLGVSCVICVAGSLVCGLVGLEYCFRTQETLGEGSLLGAEAITSGKSMEYCWNIASAPKRLWVREASWVRKQLLVV